MKKILILTLLSLLLLSSCDESVGVIGGADGPTKIVVAKTK